MSHSKGHQRGSLGHLTRKVTRAGLRTAGVFGGSTAVALAYTPVALWNRGDPLVGARWTRRWAKSLVRGFGLQIEVQGRFPEEGALVVANHRSYVDIAAIGSLVDACFIAKAQIRNWPVLGYAFHVSPTLFIDRGNRDSGQAVRSAVRERLRRGVSIINFAEGTTKEGTGLLPFKMGLFKEVFPLGIPVVPVTVTYTERDPEGPEGSRPPAIGRDQGDRRVEWVGDDTFLDHFLRLAGHEGLTAHIHVLPAMCTNEYKDLDGFVHAIRQVMLMDLAGREPISRADYPEMGDTDPMNPTS